MTSITREAIYTQAKNLIARAQALGVKKNGKDLTADQGAELLAAAIGYRNRHAFLQGATAVDSREIKVEWNYFLSNSSYSQDARNNMLFQFLLSNNQVKSFLDYSANFLKLQEYSSLAQALPKAVLCLESDGYHLQESDDGGFYWMDLMEASEDFETPQEAWLDLIKHILRTKSLSDSEINAMSPLDIVRAIEQHCALITAEKVESIYGYEHPHFLREDWKYEVSCGDTNQGYWPWVASAVMCEQHERYSKMKDGLERALALPDELKSKVISEFSFYVTGCQSDPSRILENQASFHQRIKGFLNKTQQGRVMGAFRDVTQAFVAEADEVSDGDDVVVDDSNYTAYSFGLGALSHDQLMDHADAVGVSVEAQTADELRAELLNNYENVDAELAERVYGDYDFGDEEVVDADGWAHEGTIKYRNVYLVPRDNHEANSRKVVFRLNIEGHKVTETTVS